MTPDENKVDAAGRDDDASSGSSLVDTGIDIHGGAFPCNAHQAENSVYQHC